jgi:hypothetical protein
VTSTVVRSFGRRHVPSGNSVLPTLFAGTGEYAITAFLDEDGVYGIFRIAFVLAFSPDCSKTRRLASSANFASRMVEWSGKVRVDVAYVWMSRGRAESAGAWVMRWMCRVCGEERVERAV